MQDPGQDEKPGKPNRATVVESVTEEEYPDNIDGEKPENQSPFFHQNNVSITRNRIYTT